MRHISKISSVAILALALNGPDVQALEKWEGTDDFSSAMASSAKWVKGMRGAKGEASWFDGKVIYSSTVPDSDNSASWAWGNPKKFFYVPTLLSWEISCEAFYPETGPGANLSKAVVGLVVGWFPNSKGYRAVYGRLHASYDVTGKLKNTVRCESDFNFEFRENSRGGGPAEAEGLFLTGSGRFLLRFIHNGLTQTDRFEVKNADTNELLYQRTDTSTLSLSPNCGVGFYMELDDNRIWPGLSNNMAVDNWKMEAFTPDPIDLNPQSGTVKGVAYTVAVTGLGMTGPNLNGTVSLTVGSSSASLPIRGVIDRAGRLSLRASGTGAQKGFGCTLGYDVVSGVFTPNKNSVTAPGQKPIKF